MLAGSTGAREREVRALFDSHYEALCRLAFVLLRDPGGAEEAVMDAFLKTFAGWRRIGSMDRPDLYLRKAVVNACTSRLRRLTIESKANRRVASGPAAVELGGIDHDIWAAVRSLPSRQRACVVLRYYEDRPEEEIAAILDCSPGTVKSQLAKARQKLKSALEMSGATER